MDVWVENHKAAAGREAFVRCVECAHDYPLPPLGDEFGCAACGCPSWVVVAPVRVQAA